jgi:hypothetical protein
LFVTRHAEFAHHQHIERRVQRLGDGPAHRDAAGRQGEDDDIRPVGIRAEIVAETPAGIGTICKKAVHGFFLRGCQREGLAGWGGGRGREAVMARRPRRHRAG